MEQPKAITLRDLAAIFPADTMFAVTNCRPEYFDEHIAEHWVKNWVRAGGRCVPEFADAPVREVKIIRSDAVFVLIDWEE